MGTRIERSNPEANPLSVQFKLTATNLARLPISFVNEKRRSLDEACLAANPPNSDDHQAPTRRLSLVLSEPVLQLTPSELGVMSSYASSSSGKESISASPTASRIRPSFPKNHASQSMTSNTGRLKGILSDPPVRDLFKSFLKQHFCAENLLFYLEVDDFKEKFNALITSSKAYNISPSGQEPNGINVSYPPSLRELEKQICHQAFAIYEMYLVSGAQREVNLPHQMRHDITAYMQAVVRNMEASDSNYFTSGIDSRNLPPTPSPPPSPSPSTSSTDTSDSGKTDKIRGYQKELIHISLFDMIHDHIFRLMSTDSVPKFVRTEKYLEAMMSKHKQMNTNGMTTGLLTVGQDPMGGLMNGMSIGDGAITVNGVNDSSAVGPGSSRDEGESGMAEMRQ